MVLTPLSAERNTFLGARKLQLPKHLGGKLKFRDRSGELSSVGDCLFVCSIYLLETGVKIGGAADTAGLLKLFFPSALRTSGAQTEQDPLPSD